MLPNSHVDDLKRLSKGIQAEIDATKKIIGVLPLSFLTDGRMKLN
jgi:hypothetical protein